MLRCAATQSMRSTHRRTPAPYSQGVAIRHSHASSCPTVFRVVARNTTRNASRTVTRMRVAFAAQGALPRYAFETWYDHAELGCQGPPCWVREDSCLMFHKGLSRETQGPRHARQHKRVGKTCGVLMVDVCSTRKCIAHACACAREACVASRLHPQAQVYSACAS